MSKMHQVIALVKGRKKCAMDVLTNAHHISKKTSLFNGMQRTFKSIKDGGPSKPSENQKVQNTVPETIANFRPVLADLFDTVLTQDIGNMKAVADVVASDGSASINLTNLPATNLMFLEKQVTDLITYIKDLPVLDPSEVWVKDGSNTNLYRTNPTVTQSTSKEQEAIVLYPHSEKHPAQTQLITKDVVVGEWSATKFSGCISKDDQQTMLRRATILAEAIKVARCKANETEVAERAEGKRILDFIFGV